MECSVIETSHIIGKKWSIPLIEEIGLKKFQGFNSFLKGAGTMTPRVLSARLKELEKAGLVKKRVYTRSGRKATKYALTTKGEELHQLIIKMKKWNVRWNDVRPACLSTSCLECKEFRAAKAKA